MWLNAILIVHALLSIPFGLWAIIDPSSLGLWLTGEMLKNVGEVYARLYGGCLLLIAVLTWRASASPSSPARLLIVQAMLFQQTLGAAISLTFPFPFARWFSLLMFVTFALAYLFILIFRRHDI